MDVKTVFNRFAFAIRSPTFLGSCKKFMRVYTLKYVSAFVM